MVAETQDRAAAVLAATESDDASAPFVGKWNRLVSRTNWEKGRIICQWREALVEAGASASACSDEAWAVRVGGVSAGHVGRLRRVWQRFGDTCDDFDGLYWTHFLVAMDWDDAEMWLEGAARSGWSVSQMRAQRWEALGEPEEQKPANEDVLDGDWDEDSPMLPVGDALRVVVPAKDDADGADSEIGFTPRSDEGPRRDASDTRGDLQDESESGRWDSHSKRVRPFADLPDLPEDLAEAFEQFKLAIVTHRMSAWRQVPRDDVLAALEALQALVLAPPED